MLNETWTSQSYLVGSWCCFSFWLLDQVMPLFRLLTWFGVGCFWLGLMCINKWFLWTWISTPCQVMFAIFLGSPWYLLLLVKNCLDKSEKFWFTSLDGSIVYLVGNEIIACNQGSLLWLFITAVCIEDQYCFMYDLGSINYFAHLMGGNLCLNCWTLWTWIALLIWTYIKLVLLNYC